MYIISFFHFRLLCQSTMSLSSCKILVHICITFSALDDKLMKSMEYASVALIRLVVNKTVNITLRLCCRI